MRAWGITDGSAGMEAQVRALAQVLGAELVMKKIRLKPMFSWIPNSVFAAGLLPMMMRYALDRNTNDALAESLPELVISCGRKGTLVAMGLASSSTRVMTKFINIQDPRVSSRHFDLVIAMQHDPITGPNVIKTRFALHRLTPELLAAAKEQFKNLFSPYAPPRVAVLIGGSTNKYTLTQTGMRELISQLERLQKATPCSLLMTPSRRTGAENIALLDTRFRGNEKVYIYDGKDENPYLGLLAWADFIIVTNDSVNMMSEAVATEKPVYILPMPGHENTKPARFAEGLIRDGIARTLDAKLEIWPYKAADEMGELAAKVKAILTD